MTLHTSVAIFGWLAVLYFGFCFIWDAHAWVVTSRLYSGVPWRPAKAMLKIVSRSRIHYYLWLPFAPFADIVAFSTAGVAIPFAFTLSLVAFWMHILMYQAMPPSVLLLGTSRPETLHLRHNLERALHPYRVVVFLEAATALAASDGALKKNLFEWDNLRTSDGSWRPTVFGLIAAVPAIVVDARVPTDGVVEEIRRLISHGLLDKTSFIADDKGAAPALDLVEAKVPADSVLPEASVANTLKRSRLTHTTSPDDDPILRRLG